MLYDGEILQFFHELNQAIEEKISNKHEALKHYNYFKNNKERMHYDEYRNKEYPIRSALVEGTCKLVVGKRFKGNGMRWKKKDNESVLKVRLAIINGILEGVFKPTPKNFAFVHQIFRIVSIWAARSRIPTQFLHHCLLKIRYASRIINFLQTSRL